MPFHLSCLLLGGGSTASYKNVQTAIKAYSWSDKIKAKGGLGLKVALEVKPDTDLCTGGGLGAIVLVCKAVVSGDNKWAVDGKMDLHTDLSNTGGAEENKFSITWSYTTSDDPRLYVHLSTTFYVFHQIIRLTFHSILQGRKRF